MLVTTLEKLRAPQWPKRTTLYKTSKSGTMMAIEIVHGRFIGKWEEQKRGEKWEKWERSGREVEEKWKRSGREVGEKWERNEKSHTY